MRSKDKGGRLVAWTAAVTELAPDSEEWQTAVAELKGKRLNAPDGAAMVSRWGRECRVRTACSAGHVSGAAVRLAGGHAAGDVRDDAAGRAGGAAEAVADAEAEADIWGAWVTRPAAAVFSIAGRA